MHINSKRVCDMIKKTPSVLLFINSFLSPMEQPTETVKERKSDNANIESLVLHRFKSYLQHVKDTQLWVSLTIVSVGTAWKVSKYGVFSDSYFPAFGLNTERYSEISKIILETWNLVRKYRHICSFRKYTFWYQDLLNFAVFFCKKSAFFGKNSTFTQSNSNLVR